ncbi:f-box domain-containing protein [Gigaspora margarita]|uniref:F-box domain-containing protein n=1 Tax=Gigaspora margarita TaxID=4874 RepID=A0A8H3XGW1_GIGMA|nr:f-box domain-containing protein [Gigaspora margarita]
MKPLSNECYYIIFNYFRHNYKNLFSCALVNRQWCRIVISILWSKPGHHIKNKKLIKILLLSLNEEEQVQLIPFKITLPNCPKPLFKYTNYITSVNDDLSEGVRNWIRYKKGHELEYAIEQCLILLFLRTSKLKHLSLKWTYL